MKKCKQMTFFQKMFADDYYLEYMKHFIYLYLNQFYILNFIKIQNLKLVYEKQYLLSEKRLIFFSIIQRIDSPALLSIFG